MFNGRDLSIFKLLSTWKTHLVFWLGAIFVGLSSVALTVGSELVSELFRKLHQEYLAYSFFFTPLILTLLAWITFTFFPGSERSGVPQVKASLEPSKAGSDNRFLAFAFLLEN